MLSRLPAWTMSRHTTSVIGFVPLAWLLLLAVVIAAGFEQGVLSLMAVYGTSYGIPEQRCRPCSR